MRGSEIERYARGCGGGEWDAAPCDASIAAGVHTGLTLAPAHVARLPSSFAPLADVPSLGLRHAIGLGGLPGFDAYVVLRLDC